jgi:glycosyltransferase involved in cell wall biosynthesis
MTINDISIKVLHVVAGNLASGAARGAYWLHLGLLNNGIQSKILIQENNTDDTTVEPIAKTDSEKVLRLFRSYLDKLPVKFYPRREKAAFSTGIQGFDICKLQSYKSADIIHLHWINNGMIDIKLLNKINKPIVWTMRDMWPFTGGCHYSLDCLEYQNNCGQCPQLKSHRKNDLSRYIFQRKICYYPPNIQIVAISNWLANCAKKSTIMNNFDIKVIHNCVNTEDFFPIEKYTCRKILGLPKKKKIILLGANNLNRSYKGFIQLTEMIKILDPNYLFLFFGHINKNILDLLKINYKTLGFLNDSVSLRLAYSAADVFVAPSIQEAFGKTLIEAMACGTPVVAFNATGPKDIVLHKQTGYLAQPFDPTDLACGVSWILEDCQRYSYLSCKSITHTEENFSQKKIANEYIKLYQKLLN